MAASGSHDIALFALWARLPRPYARHAVACGAEPDPVRESQDLLSVETYLAAASPRQLRVVSLAHLHRAVSRGHVPLLTSYFANPDS